MSLWKISLDKNSNENISKIFVLEVYYFKVTTKQSLKTGYQKNRQLLRMANLQQFLAVSCQLHKYISQNLGSDGHLEGLNMLKSQLNQNLWHKLQMFLTSLFFNFGRKKNQR